MRKKELKRQYHLLFIVVITVTMFVFAVIGLYDSYHQIQVNQRKNIYGGWHVAFLHTTQKAYENVQNHAIINRVGKMNVYGHVKGQSGEKSYTLGSVEDAIYEMGGIKLEIGRLPEKENELAIELSALSALEESCELGQEIELAVYASDENNRTIVREEKFVVVGIVRNYSDVWKNRNDSLVNFFVSPLYGESHVTESLNCYIQVKEQYASNVSELKPLLNGKGVLIENDYTYYEYAEEATWFLEFNREEILVFMVIIFAIAILIALINTIISQRRESFVLIRSIGGERRYIVAALAREIIPILLAGITVGMLLGLFIPALLFKLLGFYWENMTFSIRPMHMLLAISGILLTSLLSCLVGFVGILRIPMRGSIKYQAMGRDGKGYKWSKRLSLFTTFSIGCVFIISWYSCYLAYYDYQYYKELYPYDYKYGYMPFYAEADSQIPAEVLEKVNTCYGVESVSPYRISPYYEVNWEGMEDSAYVEKLPLLQSMHLPEEKKSLEQVYTCLYEVANGDERTFGEFAEQIDVGDITYEELQNSNKVIIYLPSLYEWGGEKITATKDQHYLLKENEGIKLEETTVMVGTTLKILGEKGITGVEVAAIVYQEQQNEDKKLWMPLTIVGGEELGRALNNIEEYTYIEIYGDQNVNQTQTEIELSEYCPEGVYFKSQRAEINNLFIHFLLQVLIVGVINLIGMVLLIIVKSEIADSYSEVDLKRNWLLYVLGMPRWKIGGQIIGKEIVTAAICSLFVFTGVLFFMYCGRQETAYTNFIQRYEKVDIMNMIQKSIYVNYRLRSLVWIEIIYTGLITWISHALLKRNEKKI